MGLLCIHIRKKVTTVYKRGTYASGGLTTVVKYCLMQGQYTMPKEEIG